MNDEGAQENFLNGELLLNNPIQLTLDKALTIFEDASKLGYLISIGTGHSGTIGLSQPDAFQRILFIDIIEVLKEITIDCEQIAYKITERFR